VIAGEIVRLLRPHQYTKNLLVLAAPGAAGRLDEWPILSRALLGFALFCLVSSAGYIANDLVDADADRRHPSKRFRPIARGAVSRRVGMIALIALLIVAFSLAPILGWPFTAVLVAYTILSVTYSNFLKRTPWIELAAVSGGFLLRALAGGTATDVAVSGWFLAVVGAGAFLLITGKRLGEIITLGRDSQTRPVLARYTTRSLRLLSAVAGALAIGAYSTWAAAEATDRAAGSGSSLFLRLTAVPFVLAISRYLALSWPGGAEMPERVVLGDRVIRLAGVVWVGAYAVGIYS
jgi:decaprenyl-phosphate phosphoribosyltransferase